MDSDAENKSPTQCRGKRTRPIQDDEDSAVQESDGGAQRVFLSNSALAAAAASSMAAASEDEAGANGAATEFKSEPDLSVSQPPPQKRARRLYREADRRHAAADGTDAENANVENRSEQPEIQDRLRSQLDREVQELNEPSYRVERQGQEPEQEAEPDGAVALDADMVIEEAIPAENIPEENQAAQNEWGAEEQKEEAGIPENKAEAARSRRNNAYAGEQGDANRSAAQREHGGSGALASLLAVLAGSGAGGGGGMNFMDPVRPAPLLAMDAKDNDPDEKESEERYKQYEQKLRETNELQDDNDAIQKDLAALEQVGHGTLAAHLMNRRHFDLHIPWKPEDWCFMCECGQNRQQWEKNRFYGQMIKIIEDGLATMGPDVLCRKVQMHYNKELRWTLRRKELRDMPWKKSMIWKHITEHAPTTRSMLEVERINISNIMNVLAREVIQTVDPMTHRTSIDITSTKLYLILQAKRDKVVQQLVLLRPHDTF